MRTFAILVNLILLVLVGVLIGRKDFVMESSEVPLFLFILVAPILSIIALLLRGSANLDWLSRYCARKALEERQKLERIQLRSAQPAAAMNVRPAPSSSVSGASGAAMREVGRDSARRCICGPGNAGVARNAKAKWFSG